jgi:hypothetical protein
MVTRMLNLCGLRIGGRFEMHDAANKSNPTGYWEHKDFRALNDRLLAHFGGNELLPPNFPQNWQFDPTLDPLVKEAKIAFLSLSGRGQDWGWKDPRTSLTLPFWRRLIPDLKVIVCVRNPLEVMKSFDDLLKGYGSIGSHIGGSQGSLNWYTYNASAITNSTSEERAFTSYEDYFPDFHEPLAELLEFVGLPQLDKGSVLDRRLSSLHDPGLKHHFKTIDDLLDDRSIPCKVKELYLGILNTQSDNEGRESSLEQIITKYEAMPKIDLSFYDPERIQGIVHDYILLETHNRQLEDIMSSRTHRLAARVCEFLIWREQLVNRFKADVSDIINDLIAIIDTQHKVGPMRWY